MAGIIFNETSGLNDSIFGKSQAPIKAMVKESVESFEAMSLVDKIFYMDTSTNFAEKYTSETSLGNFQATGENGAHQVCRRVIPRQSHLSLGKTLLRFPQK